MLETAPLALASAPTLRVRYWAVQHLALDRLGGNRARAPAAARNACESSQFFGHSPVQLCSVLNQFRDVELCELLAALFAGGIQGKAVQREEPIGFQRVHRVFLITTVPQPGTRYMQNATASQGDQPLVTQSVAAFTANEALIAIFTATRCIGHLAHENIISDRLDAFKTRGDDELPFAIRMGGPHLLHVRREGLGGSPERPVTLDESVELRQGDSNFDFTRLLFRFKRGEPVLQQAMHPFGLVGGAIECYGRTRLNTYTLQ